MMEIDITKAILLGIIIISAFSLGVIFGKAYYRRKYNLTRKELKRLQKQNELMKKLSPKLKWGEDEKNGKYLRKKIKSIVISEKKNDDTKTGEMVRVTEGHPKDAQTNLTRRNECQNLS